MKKILITGGGGLIGQQIAKRHVQAGDDVYLYDIKINKYNDYSNLTGLDITQSYLGDVAKILKTLKPEIISHQAALVGVGQSQYDIRAFVDNNVGFTGYLLQSILSSGYTPEKILFAGSMGPYGDLGSPTALANELHIQNPKSIYAVTKQSQENLLKVFSEAYGVPVMSLRYFSVYGTEQNPLNPYTGVLSIIANQLLNSPCVEMYDDGSQTRDLVHIEDVAEAHFLAAKLNFKDFVAVNIGTGHSKDLLSIARIMRDFLAPDKEIVPNRKHRSGDIMHMRSSFKKARDLLGWLPKHIIEEDIVTYCNYILDNRDKFTLGNTIKEENDNIQNKGLVR